MPIKVDICQYDPATIPKIEVELPDRCPECDADLTQEGAIVEGAFIWSTQHCNLDASASPPVSLTYSDANQDQPEESHVVSYICDACDHVLAETPKPISEPATTLNTTDQEPESTPSPPIPASPQ